MIAVIKLKTLTVQQSKVFNNLEEPELLKTEHLVGLKVA